jgi:hypothetical protein
LIYEVVYCSDCKKPIKSVPSWLADVNVRFSCETCRQKHPRGVLGFDSSAVARSGIDPDLEVAEVLGEPIDVAPHDGVALEDVDPDSNADAEPDEVAAGVGDE